MPKIGATWVDFLFMLPSIVLQGGPAMSSLIQRSPLANVPKSDLLPVASALAGFFFWNSLDPPPPRLVTLRGFQRSQGDVVAAWLEGEVPTLSTGGMLNASLKKVGTSKPPRS
jgi:hypothetical protein